MRRSFMLACGLVLGLATQGEPDAPAFVERIRYVGTVSYSRVVVDLSRPSPYRVQLVPADAAAEVPTRVVIDVDGAKIGVEAKEPLTVGDSLLRRIRTGQFTMETARVVLDLTRAADYRVFSLPDPYRLVIDIRSGEPGNDAASPEVVRRGTSSSEPSPPVLDDSSQRSRGAAPAPPPVIASRGKVPVPVPGVSRRLKVMLDPGHGGKDPGARGVSGIVEKDVVLSIARLVEARLREDPTIDVHLTRRDDRFLSLEERTALANAVGADLFVSIHANASPSSSAHGIEVYYLNNTNNRGTLRLAAIENDVRWNPDDPGLQSAIPDLSYILSDLRQTYKVEESKVLAEELVHAMEESARSGFPGVQGLGAKEGPFYVLVGAYMPCVLVETSFLTHPVEGARLKSLAYREALADGIFQGIHSYLQQTSIARTL